MRPKGGRLTGSTANLVTASSPVSFRQTFPSGTLRKRSANDLKRFGEQQKPLPRRTEELTVYLLEHYVLIQEACRLSI